MSIFKDTFPEYVRKQLEKRQEIVGERKLNENNTAFLQWQNTKASWIRMFSLVEIKKPFRAPLLEEFSDDYRYNILDNGILKSDIDIPTPNKLNISQRSSFDEVYKYQYDQERGHVPMPGILDAAIQTKTAYGSLREASVNFVCYSKKQFDLIEKLYMRLGHHVLIEWGWSKYIDPNENKVKNMSYILSDTLVNDRSKIKQSYIEEQIFKLKEKYWGCYDGFLGIVKNFNYDFDGYTYKCNVTLIGKGEVLSELKLNSNSIYSSNLYLNQEGDKDVDLSEIEAYFLFGDLPVKGITTTRPGRNVNIAQRIIDETLSLTSTQAQDTFLETDIEGGAIIPLIEEYTNVEDIDQNTDQFKQYQQKLANFILQIRNDLKIETKEKWEKIETPFTENTQASPNIGYSRPWLQALNEVGKSSNRNNIETYYQWGHICDVINLYIKNTVDNPNLARLQTYDSASDGFDYHMFEPNRVWEQFHYINNTILRATSKDEKQKLGGPYLTTTNYYYETGDIAGFWQGSIKVGEQASPQTTIPRLPVVYSDDSDKVIYVPNQMEHFIDFESDLYSSDLKQIENKERFLIKDIYFSKTFILETLKNSIEGDDERKIKIGAFIDTLWREANKVFGNINEFTLNTNNEINYSRVIDLNHINPIKQDRNKEIFTFESTRIGKNGTQLPFKKFGGKGSILRDLKISSKIPSGVSATIAVGAQNRGSLDALESVTFSQYNKGVRDIIYDNLEKEEDPDKKLQRELETQDRLDQNIKKKINKYLDSITNTQKSISTTTGLPRFTPGPNTQTTTYVSYLLYYPGSYNGITSKTDVLKVFMFNSNGAGINGNFEFIVKDGDRSKPFNNSLQNLIGLSNYLCRVVGYEGSRPGNEDPLKQIPNYNELDPTQNPSNASDTKKQRFIDVDFSVTEDYKQFYRPAIPLDLNITIDGISGIVIGNLFKLDLQDLPDAYSTNGDIGFIALGEDQRITRNDWVTNIKGQFQFLDFIETEGPVREDNPTQNSQQRFELYTASEENENDAEGETTTKPQNFPPGTLDSYNSVKDTKLTDNFTWLEFTSKDGRGFSGGKLADSEIISNVRLLASQLETIRKEVDGSITINSGFRSKTQNRKVRGKEDSQHLYGRAADLRPSNITPTQLYYIIEDLISKGKISEGGVGLYNSFVHYDIRGTKVRWEG